MFQESRRLTDTSRLTKTRERLNDQGLHLLVRQLAFSALLLGPAGNGSNANQTMAMPSHDISL